MELDVGSDVSWKSFLYAIWIRAGNTYPVGKILTLKNTNSIWFLAVKGFLSIEQVKVLKSSSLHHITVTPKIYCANTFTVCDTVLIKQQASTRKTRNCTSPKVCQQRQHGISGLYCNLASCMMVTVAHNFPRKIHASNFTWKKSKQFQERDFAL